MDISKLAQRVFMVLGIIGAIAMIGVTVSNANKEKKQPPTQTKSADEEPMGFIADLGWYPIVGTVLTETNSGLNFIVVSFNGNLDDEKSYRRAYISKENVDADNWAKSNPETGRYEAHIYYEVLPGKTTGAFMVEWPK